MDKYYVEIIKFGEPLERIKSMGPMSKHKAFKVDDGANINLNHEEYFTRIIGEWERDE